VDVELIEAIDRPTLLAVAQQVVTRAEDGLAEGEGQTVAQQVVLQPHAAQRGRVHADLAVGLTGDETAVGVGQIDEHDTR